MIGFLIKKTFFDFWDNIGAVLLMNIVATVLVIGFFLLPSLFGLPRAFLPVYVIPGVIALNFYFGAVVRYTLDLSDFKRSGLKAFFIYLRDGWKQSLFTSAFSLVFIGVFLFILPASLGSDSILILAVGGLSFWIWVTVLLALLFFIPASVRVKKPLWQSFRFAFAFVTDNTAFCLFMLVGVLAILALSVFLVFLLPGLAAIVLFINVGFKLRIYKYYWLEAHPGADRKKIPWGELIADDYERLGKRTVRGTIFPWKQ
jgi:hypothetical protein